MDDLELSGDALRKNLDELEVINRYLGGNAVVIDALKRLMRQHPQSAKSGWTVGDLGSGGGDLLREMVSWADRKGLKLQCEGIDANAFMIDYARDKATDYPAIQFKKGNLFDPEFRKQKYDLVTCSLFCHHFEDEQLIELFQAWSQQARVAVIINDLHRHWLAYWSIWALTRILRGSYLVQNDAPLSVKRAFRRKELEQLLQKAGITNYQLRWMWAFRYQIILPGKAE